MENISLRQMQKLELDMLLALKKVCEAHNLRYYIDGGTLLGSYCYGGFIPWDDDIDIKMPRPDYDRLKEYRREFPAHIVITTPEEDGYTYSFTKLTDTRTVLTENPGTDREHTGGVYIDILPMDGHPSKTVTMRRLERYKTLFHLSKGGFSHSLKGNLYRLLYTPRNTYRRMTALARKTAYDRADSVGLLIDGDSTKEKFRRASLEHPASMPFEGYFFPASADYETHLATFYGDHVLKPECKGNLPRYETGHSYLVYWKETK